MRFNREELEAVRRWNDCISVYDDFAHASRLAADAGFEWIAAMTIPVAASFEVSQYGRARRHYTRFGEPEELMALVSEVRRVSRVLGD